MKNYLNSILILVMFNALPAFSSEKNERLSSSVDKNFYGSFGLFRAQFTRSNISTTQKTYGRNVTYEQVKAHDDLRLERLNGYEITNVQNYIRFGYQFAEDTAYEICLYHLTYIVDIHQNVRRRGSWNGNFQDQVIDLSDDMKQYEISNGLNVLNFNQVHSHRFDGLNDFVLSLRFGLGVAIANSNSEILDPTGKIDKYEKENFYYSGLVLSGGISTKYFVYGKWYLELATEVAHADLTHVNIEYGHAKQKFQYILGSLQVGRVF